MFKSLKFVCLPLIATAVLYGCSQGSEEPVVTDPAPVETRAPEPVVTSYDNETLKLVRWNISPPAVLLSDDKEGDTISVQFPTGEDGFSEGFVFVSIDTAPGKTYVWSGEARTPSPDAPLMTGLAAHDGAFTREPFEVGSDWTPFSIEFTTNSEKTNFYIDNRIGNATLKEIELKATTISSLD